jgi:Family of unknown function (DUF695)
VGILKRDAGNASDAKSWAVYSGIYDNQPVVGRINQGAKPLAGSPACSIQIGVAVRVKSPDKNGFPQANEMKQLAAFEDGLVDGTRDRAVLVAVLTTGSMREFILYAGSDDWIPQAHTDLKALLPSHEVQMIAKTDPGWSVYWHFSEPLPGDRA